MTKLIKVNFSVRKSSSMLARLPRDAFPVPY